MSVQFEEPTIPISVRREQSKNYGKVTETFVRLGLAKDARGAQIVMIAVALLFLGASVYVFYAMIAGPSAPAEVIQAEQTDILTDLDRAGRGGR